MTSASGWMRAQSANYSGSRSPRDNLWMGRVGQVRARLLPAGSILGSGWSAAPAIPVAESLPLVRQEDQRGGRVLSGMVHDDWVVGIADVVSSTQAIEAMPARRGVVLSIIVQAAGREVAGRSDRDRPR